MRSLYKFLTIIALFLCGIIAEAQEVKNITVDEVISAVLKYNSQLSVSEKRIEIA